MGEWTPPDMYPYVDRNPSARCWLWFHGKSVVRSIIHDGRLIERYDCRCGKFYWLSQANGSGPLTRYQR